MTRHSGWSMLVGFAAAQQPKPWGTLRVAWEADITDMDPYVSPGVQSWHEVDFANYVPREHVERLARDPQLRVLRARIPNGSEPS